MISSTKPINKTSTQLKVKTTFCTISSVLSFHFSPISAWCGGSEVTSPALLYLVSLCLCCFFSVFITLFKNGRQSKFVARNSTEFRDENTCCNRCSELDQTRCFQLSHDLLENNNSSFKLRELFAKSENKSQRGTHLVLSPLSTTFSWRSSIIFFTDLARHKRVTLLWNDCKTSTKYLNNSHVL